jgi:hypothetical protein
LDICDCPDRKRWIDMEAGIIPYPNGYLAKTFNDPKSYNMDPSSAPY